jgi:hypothetical protein
MVFFKPETTSSLDVEELSSKNNQPYLQLVYQPEIGFLTSIYGLNNSLGSLGYYF